MPTERSTDLPEQLVIFIDFLGFSEAAASLEVERVRPLLDLLIGIAARKSTFSIKGQPLEDGSYKIQITPEITTFSDHIVASYPLFDRSKPAVDIIFPVWVNMCLGHARRMISTVALGALRLGLLVRGGITLGRLYHSERVVFGEGMIDAYHLESRVANYPRVVVSPRVYSPLLIDDRPHIRRDKDGIWHLDYFSPMISQAVPSGHDFEADIRRWISSMLAIIDHNIQNLETHQRLTELAKWVWFRGEFSALIVDRFR